MKKLLIPALALLLVLGIVATPASAKPAEPAQAELSFTNGSTLVGVSVLIKKGTSYLPASTASFAGMDNKWDHSGERATYSGWEKSFSVRLGSTTGVLDGRTVNIGGHPFIYNKELYIPAKFLISALEGGNVRWDAKSRMLLAKGLHIFRGYSETYGGALYSLSFESGDLYLSSGKTSKHKLTNLGLGLDVIDFTFERTPGGLTLLRVSNNYGEPHIHTEYFTYLLKNGAIIRQAHTDFKSTFSEPALWSGDKIVMNDGETLRLIEDGSGAITETINLARFMATSVKENVYYNVEALYEDVALIRPGDTAFLTLVNRSSGEQTLLYREFFDIDRQRELEIRDDMFPGDYIRFTGRSGNQLTFTAYNTGQEDPKFTYALPTGE